MKKIIKKLKERENFLLELKNSKENDITDFPNGSLRLCRHRNKTQYYKRTNPKDTIGIYIPKNEISVAYALAQKDYENKLIRSIDIELKAIERFLSSYPQVNAEEIYESLHPERQKLIKPITLGSQQFLNDWNNFSYEGKGFSADAPQFFTAKNEQVRSKSELIIANLLYSENIPYRYECPLYLPGLGRIYPDFTVLNVSEKKEFIWEHFGKMDDETYAQKTVQKINTYIQNGYFPGENLIVTFESKKCPLQQKILHLLILQYFKE